ncbi:unnamed protein product [Vitrella brassicaformis CCMP3155]|uniref:Tubulin--tyrosine ligase-like protein 9 n=4 Tax=Vitrella brassicaformis TaxID=1169539 RepID=A0A0G4EHB6_VITBC|nr:unnamed protein product [Vitrella brassicaformis CCMP3155]|eukprot:CEL94857.1 unnamed protein product [Vitrella brassicaformis CCMP3155]
MMALLKGLSGLEDYERHLYQPSIAEEDESLDAESDHPALPPPIRRSPPAYHAHHALPRLAPSATHRRPDYNDDESSSESADDADDAEEDTDEDNESLQAEGEGKEEEGESEGDREAEGRDNHDALIAKDEDIDETESAVPTPRSEENEYERPDTRARGRRGGQRRGGPSGLGGRETRAVSCGHSAATAAAAAAKKRETAAAAKKKKKKVAKMCFYLQTHYDLIRDVCESFPHWKEVENEDDDWDLFWTDGAIPADRLLRMRPYQKINHFVGTCAIARKNFLGRNLLRMKKFFPKAYRYFPQTWILPTDTSSFKAQFSNRRKPKTFILKPEAMSQGRGIQLIRRFEDVNLTERYVAQRYVHKPLLVDGLKFDLRLYVLLTGCDPLRIFLHQEGLVRFATEKYAPPNSKNLNRCRMHLTNYAVNRGSAHFEQPDSRHEALSGHKRSLKQFMQILASKGCDVPGLMAEVEEMIVKTVVAVQPTLAHVYHSCQPHDMPNQMSFEVLGFDILIDHRFKPWLIEVNHSPSFSVDSPLDRHVKFHVLRDALALLNIKPENRRKYQASLKAQLASRLMRGRRKNATVAERRADRAVAVARVAEQRSQWEEAYLPYTGYKRLYPTPEREKSMVPFFDAALQIWETLTGVSQAHLRSNTLPMTENGKGDKKKGPKANAEGGAGKSRTPTEGRKSQAPTHGRSKSVHPGSSSGKRHTHFDPDSRKRISSSNRRAVRCGSFSTLPTTADLGETEIDYSHLNYHPVGTFSIPRPSTPPSFTSFVRPQECLRPKSGLVRRQHDMLTPDWVHCLRDTTQNRLPDEHTGRLSVIYQRPFAERAQQSMTPPDSPHISSPARHRQTRPLMRIEVPRRDETGSRLGGVHDGVEGRSAPTTRERHERERRRRGLRKTDSPMIPAFSPGCNPFADVAAIYPPPFKVRSSLLAQPPPHLPFPFGPSPASITTADRRDEANDNTAQVDTESLFVQGRRVQAKDGQRAKGSPVQRWVPEMSRPMCDDETSVLGLFAREGHC